MKNIFDLKHAISNKEYLSSQFSEEKKREKNIVFVNPQLSDKHLYKMLLPVCWFKDKKESPIATAITGLSAFNTESQLFGEGEWNQLTDDMIRWATTIVLPFTVQPLVMDLYARIRNINPKVIIVYNVDFNFYELSEKHPYRYIFEEETVIDAVEDNMYHCDVIMVSNFALQDYLHRVFQELLENKYKDTPRRAYTESLKIEWQQLYTDEAIVMSNVDYVIQKSISSTSKNGGEFLNKLSEVADKQLKKESKGKVKEKKAYKGRVTNDTKLKKQIKKSTEKENGKTRRKK